MALEAAISELKHHLAQEDAASAANEAYDDSKLKERLLACDSAPDAHYTVALPTWANAPISDGNDADAVFHVYEVKFESESGEPFVTERSGIDAGPLGIAFPKDIQPSHPDIPYETHNFYLERKNGKGMERVIVRLCKQETLNLNDLLDRRTTIADRISWMTEFNQILSRWKERPQKSVRPMDETSPIDRTYLFVPLMKESEKTVLDWTLLQRIAARECSSCIHISSWTHVGVIVTVTTILTLFAYNSLTGKSPVDRTTSFAPFWELCSILTVLIALFCVATTKLAVSSDVLVNNHVLSHKRTGKLYLTHKGVNDVGSKLWPFSGGPRISCTPLTSHSKSDFLLKEDTKDEAVCLIPSRELEILPFPRHYLYLGRHIMTFMPLVEREIELTTASIHMQALSNSTPIADSNMIAPLSSLLREATTLTPKPKYQRLEFLGDSVLAFFVVLAIMARNPALKLTYDDIESHLSVSTKNSTLCDAALQIGANQLIFCGQRERKWRSRYSGDKGLNKLMRSTRVAICDSIMSDTVESLLGAAFMHDMNCNSSTGRSVSAALFDRLQLPNCKENCSIKQVNILSSCLHNGYPFETDVAWHQQIFSLRETLLAHQEDAKQLEKNLERLICTLVHLSGEKWLCETFECGLSRVLLFSALFHDNGIEVEIEAAYANDISNYANTDSNQHENSFMETTVGAMLRLSRFREMIFLAGAYALQLCITTELFKRYPNANERDLHTLRARAIADDIVVYIMFKAGIQNTVYKMESEIIEDLERKINKADYHGLDLWKAQDGWWLPGGKDEFARRRRMSPSPTPQYPGCAGGRLAGKTKKLDLKYTEEPMFVMKAIIGALVLSHGIERMWKCIGPLFEELFLLSPEESLRIFKDSNVK